MPKIWCAAIECKHNKGNQCRAKEVNLTEGHLHTVHQGFKQVWGCRTYEESEDYKALRKMIENRQEAEKR